MFLKKLIFLLLLSSSGVFASGPEHFQAALDTVMAPEGDQLDQIIDGLVQAQISANPKLYMAENAFRKFYKEVLGSEAYRNRLAKVQMETFSYDELVQIKEMMNTPIFKIYRKRTPALMTKIMQVGITFAQENQGRLVELIKIESEIREKSILNAK